MKEECYDLDAVKSVAIILVCSFHFQFMQNPWGVEEISAGVFLERFFYSIFSICIPLFFLVNGALVLNRPLKFPKFCGKVIKMSLQYLIWRAITIVVLGGAFGILLNKGRVYLFNGIWFGGFEGIDLNHFWFISCMIAVYILLPFIKVWYDSYKDSSVIWIVLAVLGFFYMMFNSFSMTAVDIFKKCFPVFEGMEIGNVTSFWSLQPVVGGALFYMILGAKLYSNIERLKKIEIWKWIVVFVVGVAWHFVKSILLQPKGDANWDNVANGYFTIPVAVMASSGLIIICILSGRMELKKWFCGLVKVVGRNTLFVYYMHWIIGYLFLFKVRVYVPHNWITNECKALILVLTLSFLGLALKKVPFVNKLIG